MFFVIHAYDIPDGLALRRANTDKHVAYLKSQPLKLHLAGPLLDEQSGDPKGSLLIVDAPDRDTVVAFNQNDPYTKAGLFSEIRITELRKTVGWVD